MGKGQSEKKKQVAFKAKHPEGRGEFAKAKRAARVAKRRAEVEKRGAKRAEKEIAISKNPRITTTGPVINI